MLYKIDNDNAEYKLWKTKSLRWLMSIVLFDVWYNYIWFYMYGIYESYICERFKLECSIISIPAFSSLSRATFKIMPMTMRSSST